MWIGDLIIDIAFNTSENNKNYKLINKIIIKKIKL